MTIKVDKITYRYKTFSKKEGLRGTLRDFFKRNHDHNLAVDEVSFQLEKGTIVGLLGPNGAGKTTLIKILTGMLAPNEGSVSVMGFEPHKKNKNFLRQIGVVLGQRSQLIWDLPPKDTFATLRVIYGVSQKEYSERINYFSNLLNLDRHLNTPTRNLSLGERMKCEFIAALLHNPKVLFLDEPTIGLDIFSQKAIRDFLTTIAHELGVTILFTSHHLIDIEKLCDRLLIIREGAITYDGSVEQLVENCSQKYKIEYQTIEKQSHKIECETSELNQVLHQLTSKYVLTDLKLNKGSLEEAIYAILEQR